MSESGVQVKMTYRVLGSTGEQVSAICLGGWHLGLKGVAEQLSVPIISILSDRFQIYCSKLMVKGWGKR
jgi:hypothetical protein